MNTIPKKLGRYYIIWEIGRGAMGVVYKAHDPVIEREVALKAIQLSFQVTEEERTVYLNRFYREAKAAGKLSHPGIVTIYDVGEDKETGIPFIVMEFLEGTTLQEVITSGILLPVEDVCSIVTQVADALSYAHDQGVVHRDIKSANIMILEGMKPKIMDFGIARLPGSDLTKSGQFIGTPNYMSPEQIEGKTQVDGRSDLFSLGVIFYMLLTGERPFPGDNFNTVSYKIVHVDPIPPRVVNPAVPETYNLILDRLLAKDPAKRYPTGADLIADLKMVETNGHFLAAPSANDRTAIANPSLAAQVQEEEKQIDGKKMASSETRTVFPTQKIRHLIPIAGVILLAAALTTGSIYLLKSFDKVPPKQASQPVVNPVDPSKAISKQNTIRSKWDLAVSYYQSGLYDKSIDEFNSILQIDPAYEEAKKYLELVKRKKELEEQKKQAAAQQAAQALKSLSHPAKASSKLATPEVKAAPLPATEVAAATVDFELEHTLPSGTFSIYLNDRQVYQGTLIGTEKRVLLFRNYKGKLTGSVKVPFGPATLGLHVVCKELGISAYKKISANLKQGESHSLRIKFYRVSKQLEVKWT